jgi:flagellar biosynthesis chaperone FliJ
MAIAGEFLPPVVTRLTMNLDGFLAGLAEAKAALSAFKDSAGDIDLGLGIRTGDIALTIGELKLMQIAVSSLTDANYSLAISETAAAGAANGGYRAWFRNGTIIHWLISGTAELAAVLLPATVAFASFAFVWLQGATNIYEHLNALFDATEALGQSSGKTYGEMLGLSGVFQRMQNAADPQVYQALGAALELARESSGGLAVEGQKLGVVFDTFLAKVVTDFSKAGQAGSTLNLALGHMEPDAIELARVFGNLGAALVSLATQMPGLAEFLLGSLADILDLIKVVVELTGQFHYMGITLLTLAIGYEEFNRWGALVVSGLSKIGLATTNVEGKWYSLTHTTTVFLNLFRALPLAFSFVVQGLGNVMSRMTIFGEGWTNLGSKVTSAGERMEETVAGVSLGTAVWITVAVAAAAAIGYLVYRLATAKNAAQKYSAALEQAATTTTRDTALFTMLSDSIFNLAQRANASGSGAAAALQAMHAKIDGTTEGVLQLGAGLGRTGRAVTDIGTAMKDQSAQQAYTQGMIQLAKDSNTATSNAQMLARTLHISVPEAMALAQIAGVNLTKTLRTQNGAWTDLGQKVADQLAGFRAMGAASGEVGHDMQMVAVQEGLAASKMQQVEQAFQQFMQNVTGGTAGLSQLVTSIAQMGHVTAHTAENLGTAASISESVKQEADAIAHYGSTGAQAMTNFDQVVGSSIPQLVQWFQTAQAEGAITAPKFQQAIYDMIAPMLPFAAKSKEAQTELVALAQAGNANITTFPQLVAAIQAAHGHLGGLQSIVTSTTSNMADLSKVAQNLGNVVDSDLTSAIVNAWTNFYHLDGAVKTLTEDQQKYGDNSNVTARAAQHVAQVLQEIQQHAQSTTRAIDQQTEATRRLKAAMDQLHSRWITIHVQEAIAVHEHGGVPGPGGAPVPRSETGAGSAETSSAVYLDGKKVGRVISKNAVKTQKRSGTNQMQKRRR